MGQTDPGQVFRDAADIIRRDGWQIGVEYTGKHCAYDALAEAQGLPNEVSEIGYLDAPRTVDSRWTSSAATKEGQHLQATLNEQLGDGRERSVYHWNDSTATEDDVIALFEKAATSAPVDL